MAEALPFKVKMFKSLYGMGLKNFGSSLLTELPAGGDEWILFVTTLLEGTDYPTRKIAISALTRKGFVERSRNKARLLDVMMVYLAKGLGDEKRAILKFVEGNLGLFPTEDDSFRAKILSLRRERDPQLSAAAEALLPKIGVNMDDPNMFRRA